LLYTLNVGSQLIFLFGLSCIVVALHALFRKEHGALDELTFSTPLSAAGNNV
jgi:hypothetical protein